MGAIAAPFTLTGTILGGEITLDDVPSSANAGSLIYQGGGNGVTLAGTGSYTIADGSDGTLVLTQTSEGCVEGALDSCRTNSDVIILTLAS